MLRAGTCQQPFSSAPGVPAALRRSRIAVARPSRRENRLQIHAGLQDPWATLGVPHNATEKEIKKAHRKLVLQHHPDVKADDPLAHARFLRIQEAYELIMGKRQGKEIDQRPAAQGGWDWHDWYWKFSMKRRNKGGKGGPFAGAAGGAEPPPPAGGQWRAQMAGLKQKAAAKRGQHAWQRRRQGQGQDKSQAGDAGAAAQAGAAARESRRHESAWRSMTKNARSNPEQAAAQAAAAAAEKLGNPGGGGGPQAQMGAGPLNETRRPPAAEPATATAAAPATAEAPTATAGREEPPAADHPPHGTGRPAERSTRAGQAPTSHTAPGPHAGSELHAQRLQRLLEHAAALVNGVQQGAGGAAQALHTRRRSLGLGEHAAAAGRHLRAHLHWEQLSALLGRQRQAAAAAQEQELTGAAGNAVPADPQLHHRFEATRRRLMEEQQAQERAADAAAAAAAPASGLGAGPAECDGSADAPPPLQSEQQQQQHSHAHNGSGAGGHRNASHARKFANREEVEGRLSSQLAGLKRRAALKQEVQSSC